MRKKISPLYYFIPVLHVLVIACLIFLQWKPELSGIERSESAAVESPERTAPVEPEITPPVRSEEREVATSRSSKRSKFKKEVGSIFVYSNKKSRVSGQSAKISSAVVEAGGFAFLFESKKNLTWIGNEGKKRSLSLKEVQFDRQSITMVLNDEVTVRFQNKGSDEVEISLAAPTSGRLEVLLEAASKSKINAVAGDPIFSAVKKKKNYQLLQAGSSTRVPKLTLTPGAGAASALVVAAQPDLSGWASAITRYSNLPAFDAALYQYQQKAYNGWEKGRYNSESGFWKMASGREGVSPELVSAFATEAYRRNSPKKALSQLTRPEIFKYDYASSKYENLEINPKAASFSTALLYGSIKKGHDQAAREASVLLSDLRKASSLSDYVLFSNPKLVESVALWGSGADEQKLFELISKGADLKRSDLLASFIASGVRVIELYPAQKDRLVPVLKTAAAKLAGRISFNAAGAFLTSDGEVLGEATVIAAMAFEALRKTAGVQTYGSLASLLMKSATSISDADGFIAERSEFATLTSVGSARLAPESFYAWMPDKSCAPRVERFNTDASGAILVYHRAKSVRLVEEGGNITLNFNHWHQSGSDNFAVAALNNFVVKSLRTGFVGSMRSTTPWPADPGFEAWRVGFYYWESERMAAVMLRHRSTEDDFSFIWM